MRTTFVFLLCFAFIGLLAAVDQVERYFDEKAETEKAVAFRACLPRFGELALVEQDQHGRMTCAILRNEAGDAFTVSRVEGKQL